MVHCRRGGRFLPLFRYKIVSTVVTLDELVYKISETYSRSCGRCIDRPCERADEARDLTGGEWFFPSQQSARSPSVDRRTEAGSREIVPPRAGRPYLGSSRKRERAHRPAAGSSPSRIVNSQQEPGKRAASSSTSAPAIVERTALR